ncbi:MAG: hypothetical protein KF799_03005 [Bdellovibrionales bacterium]|nr:hypothetical protein [Bdellovibrionales bacterium]
MKIAKLMIIAAFMTGAHHAAACSKFMEAGRQPVRKVVSNNYMSTIYADSAARAVQPAVAKPTPAPTTAN